MKTVRFPNTIQPRQGAGPRVVCFAATAQQIAQIAGIQRIARGKNGKLVGFQRQQIASHIREIRDYLAQSDAIMPTSIVLAFSEGVKMSRDGALTVTIKDRPLGWIVDGQQRLAAALSLPERSFQFIVTAFLCDSNIQELNRQFILVNNTRPLSKQLIYELLPGIDGLPHRLSDRSGAALLTETLNYHPESSLRGEIQQQTNPEGIIKDTLIQKLLMNSLQQGALREFSDNRRLVANGYRIVSNFFAAVKSSFRSDWEEHTPKTSRLLHGVGIVSMGYVMDELHIAAKAVEIDEFEFGLRPLRGKTHWTKGEWNFAGERRPWNSLQNTGSDYRMVSHYLVRILRREIRQGRYSASRPARKSTVKTRQ
ncbi:MAG: DGQHR domain-containing protein DpdB [Vulcanimicrobiaceae bacterium]